MPAEVIAEARHTSNSRDTSARSLRQAQLERQHGWSAAPDYVPSGVGSSGTRSGTLNRGAPRVFSRACTRWLTDAWVNPSVFAVLVKLLNSAAFENVSRFGSCRSSGCPASTAIHPQGLHAGSFYTRLTSPAKPPPSNRTAFEAYFPKKTPAFCTPSACRVRTK